MDYGPFLLDYGLWLLDYGLWIADLRTVAKYQVSPDALLLNQNVYHDLGLSQWIIIHW